MKKLPVILILLLAIVISGVLFLQRSTSDSEELILKPSEERKVNVEQTIKKATPTIVKKTAVVKIDFGEGKIISGEVEAINALDALIKLAKKNALAVTTKEYKFGSMVEKVGTKENNNQNAWLFYVNGKSVQFAADKLAVRANDTIEWKYSKIN